MTTAAVNANLVWSYAAAALLIQRNPSITPDEVKTRLMKTAAIALPMYENAVAADGTPFTFQGDAFTVGAGYLDIFAALQNNDVIQSSALSPAVQYNAAIGQVTLVRDLPLIWGDSIIWGDAIIWGDTLADGVNGSSIIWGDSVAWGNQTWSGFSIIWGDSVNTATPPQGSSANNGDKF